MEQMTPEEFEETQEAAAEDEFDHTIEQFSNAAEWNVYVAARESGVASMKAGDTNSTLSDYEYLAKIVGTALLIGLAIEGGQAILSGRRY